MRKPEDADLPGEIWRPVVGWERLYSVSSMGRVRRELAGAGGPTYPGKVLACSINRGTGYRAVLLSDRSRSKWQTVHRLVCEAFLGPRGDLEVNHINGDGSDPRLANLEYVTHKQNAAHAAQVLGRWRGAGHHNTVLTPADIIAIRARLAAGDRQGVIAADFGIRQWTISDIKRRRTWGHVE